MKDYLQWYRHLPMTIILPSIGVGVSVVSSTRPSCDWHLLDGSATTMHVYIPKR